MYIACKLPSSLKHIPALPPPLPLPLSLPPLLCGTNHPVRNFAQLRGLAFLAGAQKARKEEGRSYSLK